MKLLTTTTLIQDMTNYHNRQLGIIDPALLDRKISIIGAGSIGSWATLALVKLGCTDITVFDFDSVEDVNVGSQIYTSRDIGKTKVEALKDKIQFLTDGNINIQNINVNEDSIPLIIDSRIVILAVDAIEVRKTIFEALKSTSWPHMLLDGRMSGNVAEIYTVNMDNAESIQNYESSLFLPSEASVVECSMRSVVYNVFVMGGFITDIVSRVCKSESVPEAITIDLTNFYMQGGLI